ncbi:hypothetical protein FRC03_008156 [Tulasnella sp. 419]|nr:hypothetical protein FRC02_003270 [Tulasnella sp. 418]KAG8959311.1 hypothetical protein FRC03_008156 [Tulasnella sp. 419]
MLFLPFILSFLSAIHIVTAVEVFADGITFTGDWVPEPDPNVECPHSYTNDQTATASLTFRGNYLDVFLPKAGNGGMVTIRIDDTTVERDGKSDDDYMCDIPIYSTDLPMGQHTVTVKLTTGTTGFINVHKFVYHTPEEIPTISSQSTASLASAMSTSAAISAQSAISMASITSTMSVISVRVSGGVRTVTSSPDGFGTAAVGTATSSSTSGGLVAVHWPKEGLKAVLFTLLGAVVAILM